MPVGDSTITAGDTIAYAVTARDQYGNAIATNGGINILTPGSTTAEIVEGSPLLFGGTATVNFNVTDTVSGAFSVRVENTGNQAVIGQSGLVTVTPAAADHIVLFSGVTDSITVGSTRLLQVALEDVYTNRISGSSVTFTRTTSGTGYFITPGNADTVVTTDANGVAAALYTASDNISFMTDSIRTQIGVLVDSLFGLPLRTGAVVYYTLIPAADSTFAAGDTLDYIVTVGISSVMPQKIMGLF